MNNIVTVIAGVIYKLNVGNFLVVCTCCIAAIFIHRHTHIHTNTCIQCEQA